MSQAGYTIEVTGLSPQTTEKVVHDFFAFCGAIDHIDIIRSGDQACTAYVTFRNVHAQETAILLSGATILDERVCITSWGRDEDETGFWNRHSQDLGGESSLAAPQRGHFVPNAGQAVDMTQDVVKNMLAKGYVLSRDALGKAKAFDESHQVSATASAKVAELSQRIGLTNKIYAGVEVAKSVDQRYHVSEAAKSAASVTGRTAAAAATSVVNSSYFSKGALWVSGALDRAAKTAADFGTRNATR